MYLYTNHLYNGYYIESFKLASFVKKRLTYSMHLQEEQKKIEIFFTMEYNLFFSIKSSFYNTLF